MQKVELLQKDTPVLELTLLSGKKVNVGFWEVNTAIQKLWNVYARSGDKSYEIIHLILCSLLYGKVEKVTEEVSPLKDVLGGDTKVFREVRLK